jgi:NodT family efflux transporter outer membrane factor (OMF) lipoprotein
VKEVKEVKEVSPLSPALSPSKRGEGETALVGIARFALLWASVRELLVTSFNSFTSFTSFTVLLLTSGCTVGPDYVRPDASRPAAYKEAEGWKVARPQDAIARGKWWEMYGDFELNALMAQVQIANLNVAQAEAAYRQARAVAQAARAAYFPTISVGASITRSHQSQNLGRLLPSQLGTVTDYLLPVDLTWELDLWGRIRRTVESQQAAAQASAADYENIQLSAQAELAQDYFLLRALDTQKQLLDASSAAYDKSLQLTKNRYAGGVASRADVAISETQLRTTQAQAIDVTVQRAQLEHAIAILIGKPPSEFSLPPATLAAVPPPTPAGVPSTLLERRPDVAAAERRVAAANAQIGVAIAAYYPTVTLGASVGFESADASKWLEYPSRFWSIGPAISETVFDAGLRRAQTAQARAAYDQNVAFYRQAVLTGFKEVEDNIAALRILEQEAQVQADAVKAAEESVALTINQYKAGVVSYLNVVVVQTAALNNERTAVDIQNRRLAASVLLIKALGGGWDASMLPDANALARTDDARPSESAPVGASAPGKKPDAK